MQSIQNMLYLAFFPCKAINKPTGMFCQTCMHAMFLEWGMCVCVREEFTSVRGELSR
jgi:hypothetical protein